MERAGKVVRLPETRPRYGRIPLAALSADPKLRGETWRVLVALCGFADKTGHCWPSRERLAEDSKVEQRNLGRNLRPLTEAGLIRINGTDDYTVILEHCGEPEQHTGEPEQHTGEPEQHTGVSRAIKKNRPSNKTSEADHLTTRARASENAVEILTPIEVERSEQFELLWLEYPSRPDDPKELARRAFDELISKGVDPNVLIDAAVRYGDWARRDAPGGAYVPHMHRWLREGRYQHHGKSWPRPRQDIVGIMAEIIQSGPLIVGEDQSDNGSGRPAPVFWTDRLDQLERTGIWAAEWGPAPDDSACQLPQRFRSKPCVRRWLEHKANVGG
jgi:Helix-turn-helix domain